MAWKFSSLQPSNLITAGGLQLALEKLIKGEELDMTVKIEAMQDPNMLVFLKSTLYSIHITPTEWDHDKDLPFLTRIKVIYKALAEGLPRHVGSATLMMADAPEGDPWDIKTIEKYATITEVPGRSPTIRMTKVRLLIRARHALVM